MRRTLVLAAVLASSAVFFAPQARAEEGSLFRQAIRSEGGVVASESPEATRAGLEVQDAVVATTLRPAATDPRSGPHTSTGQGVTPAGPTREAYPSTAATPSVPWRRLAGEFLLG